MFNTLIIFKHTLPLHIKFSAINVVYNILLHRTSSMQLSFVKVIKKLGEILNFAFHLLKHICKHLMIDLI